jgi:hypothetical protein
MKPPAMEKPRLVSGRLPRGVERREAHRVGMSEQHQFFVMENILRLAKRRELLAQKQDGFGAADRAHFRFDPIGIDILRSLAGKAQHDGAVDGVAFARQRE